MLSGPFTMRLDDGRELEYYIDRGRRQNIYISVKERRVVLKLPQGADAARGESFLRKKGSWVLKAGALLRGRVLYSLRGKVYPLLRKCA